MPDIATGLVYYVVFLFSTTLHEASHALAALKGGDPTAYHGGQVTLDPRPHIKREPIGMVILPLISVLASGWPLGFASAPYDPNWALRHPKRAAWMSLAGPAANFTLMLVAALLIRIGLAVHVFEAPQSVNFDHVVTGATEGLWTGVAFALSVFFSLNLLLATFNLLPLPPLDGSGAIPLLLDDTTSRRYLEFMMTQGRSLGFIGIFIAWQVFGSLFHPIWLFAVNLLHPGLRYG